MRRFLVLATLATFAAVAQQEYHLRVTVDLVQVDATVTDSRGNPVADLKPVDFRVLLDGKPQQVKYCNYIHLSETPKLSPLTAVPAAKNKATTAAQPAIPATPIQREDVRRTLVVFVADLLTSAESMPRIRAGLKKFVQEQVQPGDLVAIVRSSAGLGALQDFTIDKGMLLAAVDMVAWKSKGSGGDSAYSPIGLPGSNSQDTRASDLSDNVASTDRSTLATTAALLRLVRGMADLPGRKSVVLISDALRLTSLDGEGSSSGKKANGKAAAFLSEIYWNMRQVADESVRAGVVLYAIDTRGTSSLRASASDRLTLPGANTRGPASAGPGAPPSMQEGDWVSEDTGARRTEYQEDQWGAKFLASQTGGFVIAESNRIDAGLERIMADQRGYYMLGFQPPEGVMHPEDKPSMAFAPPQPTLIFHDLKIEVLRPGLKVRSHTGFFGVSDTERTAPARPELQLSQSLASPFRTADLNVEVESSYLNVKDDYFIQAALYIDGRDVVFRGPPIHRTGVVHVILRVFNANGETLRGGIDQIRRIDLNEEGYQRTRKYGLIYTAFLPVPKPGPYQIRAACEDKATGKVGTGADFVSIPRSKVNGLRLSGVVFQHAVGTYDHVVPALGPSAYSAGQRARFSFQIVSSGPKPQIEQLQMLTRIFRDGAEVWESAPMPVEADATKIAGIFVKGSLEIPKGLDPGNYLVRVDVSDKARPETPNAWQWAKLKVQ